MASRPAPRPTPPAVAAVPIPTLPVPASPAGRVVRGQSQDETPLPSKTPVTLAPLSMPSPEALGLISAKPTSPVTPVAPTTDWGEARRRMQQLGVVAFQVQEQAQGWRFVCQLRTAEPGRLHRIETGPVATEAEAIHLALTEAERWASQTQ